VPIIIILNDTTHYLTPLNDIVNSYCPTATVLHHSQVAPWTYPTDWWSQQYYKLAISSLISTPWYLLLDSDDIIINDLTNDVLFDQGYALCYTESRCAVVNSTNPYLIGWLKQAYNIFKLSQLPEKTMGNLTPFMMNTEIAKQVFGHISIDCFNTQKPTEMSLEFYLYYAYLDQQQIFQNFYRPVKNLKYVNKQQKFSAQ
jgi:hypothetical protein